MAQINVNELELQDKVIKINRVAKVVKGGRRFSFSALVVIGNQNGYVGEGYGKSREVSSAILKAIQDAKKNIIKVPVSGATLPHQIIGHYGSGKVLLKPASDGTGLIAGHAVKAVLELAGLKDVVSKSLGSNNPLNLVRATFEALKNIRSKDDFDRLRGKADSGNKDESVEYDTEDKTNNKL